MTESTDLLAELEAQLRVQRSALAEVEEVLSDDPLEELEELRQELLDAVRVAEEAIRELQPQQEEDQAADEASQGTSSISEEESDTPAVGNGTSSQQDNLNEDAASVQGLGSALEQDARAVLQAVAAGPQTDTVHFADWESHTRGIGSALMARMGYVQGSGLGASGEGMSQPLQMQRLRTKAGLGTEDIKQASAGKKRKRSRKKAEAAREADNAHKDAELAHELATGDVGVFAFINGSLGQSSSLAAEARHRHTSSAEAGPVVRDWRGDANMKHAGAGRSSPGNHAVKGKQQKQDGGDRRALAYSQDAVTALRQKVTHYEQMGMRNARDAVIAKQVKVKLAKARQDLEQAESAHRAQHAVINNKDNQKKWLKF
ncbi:hypothetical protein WJX73_002014 [Symbiochloris irregularis]|uniref:G-patch domain-containing protein n=1 Tax=Symbiochloris irregularis TaxID=706552 RepID=A0AAW1NL68_9CHLO